jgi:hypothetical protein
MLEEATVLLAPGLLKRSWDVRSWTIHEALRRYKSNVIDEEERQAIL